MTIEESIQEAMTIYTRGFRKSKKLLDIQYKLLLSEITLQTNLKGTSFMKLSDDQSNEYSNLIKASKKHFFIQGYLAAKGYENGIYTEADETKLLTKKTVKVK